MKNSASDVMRIKQSAKKILAVVFELPNWAKNLGVVLLAIYAMNSLENVGESVGHALYYFLN
jgi:hypothetical protein